MEDFELLPNMVLAERHQNNDDSHTPPREWVILDPDRANNIAWAIERDVREAVPKDLKYKDVCARIQAGLLELSRKPLSPPGAFACSPDDDAKSGDPDADGAGANQKGSEHRRAKTLAFRRSVIDRLAEVAPLQVLYASTRRRGQAIRQVATEFKISAKTLRRWLTRWLQAGRIESALLTRYSACGNRGMDRVSKDRPTESNDAATKKPKKCKKPKKPITRLGNKRNDGTNGVVTDHIHYPRMYTAWREMRKENWSPSRTYYWMLGTFYASEIVSGAGDCPMLKPNAKAPTYRQFKYWLDKAQSTPHIGLSRPARRRISKSIRSDRAKNARTDVGGPGELYEIDATVLDIYVVAYHNRQRVIGRPVLYIVIDVFSGMVVSAYITVENASWAAAMGAIDAILEDKVALCANAGRDITAAMWPNSQLPQSLQSDNAELKGLVAERLLKATGLRIAHHPAYWPQWKAYVERSFRTVNEALGDYVDGYVDWERERGEKDYRGEAIMTVEEVFAIVLSQLVDYNNSVNDAYIMTPDMEGDKIEPRPSVLWAWGIKRRSGLQRVFDREFLRFALLPMSDGKITPNGLSFKGVLYDSPALETSGTYAQVGANGNKSVVVTYDPRCMDTVYIHDPNNPKNPDARVLAEITHEYRHMRGCSLQELEKHNKESKALKKAGKPYETAVRAQGAVFSANTTNEARAKTANAGATGMTVTERTKNMREERAHERKQRAKKETFVPGSVPTIPKQPPLPSLAAIEDLDASQFISIHRSPA